MSDEQWNTHVKKMKDSIMGNEEIYNYLLSFEPKENEGYCWTRDTQYKKYSDILDDATGRIHSGASFSICIRAALEEIKTELNELINGN
jgi:hypothetical protein